MDMKLYTKYSIWISLTVLAMAILACIGNTPVVPGSTQVPPVQPTPVSQNPGPTQVPQGSPTPAINLSDLSKATVQIIGDQSLDGDLISTYIGSGTIISSTGLILTNAHIASPASQGHQY